MTTNALGKLLIPGDEAMKIRLTNESGEQMTARLPLCVTGTGTLTLTVNGHVAGTYTAADGAFELKLKNALAANDVILSYAAGDADAGCVELDAVLGPTGLIFMLK